MLSSSEPARSHHHQAAPYITAGSLGDSPRLHIRDTEARDWLRALEDSLLEVEVWRGPGTGGQVRAAGEGESQAEHYWRRAEGDGARLGTAASLRGCCTPHTRLARHGCFTLHLFLPADSRHLYL